MFDYKTKRQAIAIHQPGRRLVTREKKMGSVRSFPGCQERTKHSQFCWPLVVLEKFSLKHRAGKWAF